MSVFEVHVVPRSKPGPDGRYDGLPRLRLKSPPADGRANTEAERLLSEALGTSARLKRGGQSRRKVFEVDVPSGELASTLRRVFGN